MTYEQMDVVTSVMLWVLGGVFAAWVVWMIVDNDRRR